MLRLQFGVTTEEYLVTQKETFFTDLGRNRGRVRIFRRFDRQVYLRCNFDVNSDIGKSDSTFIFSQDKKFVLKTLSKRESKNLRDIVGEYYHHMTNFPGSFLQRMYGHYRLDVRNKKVYFVVLGNVLDSNKTIHETYDLKVTRVITEK
jgi:hypothetical protein